MLYERRGDDTQIVISGNRVVTRRMYLQVSYILSSNSSCECAHWRLQQSGCYSAKTSINLVREICIYVRRSALWCS